MTDKKHFPDFAKATSGTPDFAKATSGTPGFGLAASKPQSFFAKRFGEHSALARIWKKIGPDGKGASPLDSLTQIRQQHTSTEKINLALTIALIVILALSWKNIPPLLTEINQKRGDNLDQTEKLAIEKENNATLEKLKNDKARINSNRSLVESALPPNHDEKAEDVISMIENMGYPEEMANILTFESIGIREVPDSQFYNDDLVGTVKVYEYAFSAEGSYSELTGFIQRLRRSKRLMDLMTLEIEEKKEGGFKATFSVFAYNLVGETPSAPEPKA